VVSSVDPFGRLFGGFSMKWLEPDTFHLEVKSFHSIPLSTCFYDETP